MGSPERQFYDIAHVKLDFPLPKMDFKKYGLSTNTTEVILRLRDSYMNVSISSKNI